MAKIKKYKNIKKLSLIIKFLAFVLFLGSIFGSILVNMLEKDKFNLLVQFLTNFIDNYGLKNFSQSFFESFFNNVKYLIIIWFLGYIKAAPFFVTIVIFFKGLSYGFTSSIFVQKYELASIIYTSFLYLPQSFIIIPAYFFVALKSFQYSNKLNKNKANFKQYLFVLLFILIVSLIISLVDLFISPKFIYILK